MTSMQNEMQNEITRPGRGSAEGGVTTMQNTVSTEEIAEFRSCLKVAEERRRGYVPWRPAGNSKQLLADVERVFAEYEAHLPLTIRQIFYRLVGAYGYEKSDSLYERLIYLLGRARRARRIPFDWVRDDGISVASDPWFGETAAFWDHVAEEAREYRRDKQQRQPVQVEVWTEATGMLPQLARVARYYSVPVYSAAGGFAGLCAVRMIVDHAVARNVPTILLHVGDFDLHGEDIFAALAEDTAAFLAEDKVIGTQKIIAERVALTADQVAAYALPTDRLKQPKGKAQQTAYDRWVRKHGDRTCQLEALPPDVLADELRQAIERHLDIDLLAEHEDAEQAERIQLLRALPSGAAA